MGCTFFWVKFYNAFHILWFVFTSQMALLFHIKFARPNCAFLFLVGMENIIIFTQESFYLQGILNDINEQNTSFLDCKHKHMMKSGAPPDKIGVLHCLLPTEFHGFTSRIDF